MKKRVVYLAGDGEEISYVLEREKEKVIVGRHKTCDMIVKSKDVSRRHVAIVQKFDCLYIENISSTGTLEIDGRSVEYVDFPEGVHASLGSHQLWWKEEELVQHEETGSSNEEALLPQSETNNAQEVVVDSESSAESFSVPMEIDSGSQVSSPLVPLESGEDLGLEPAEGSNFDSVQLTNDMGNSLKGVIDGKTQIVAVKACPVMRVIRGELVGREIRMEHGMEWIVGRGRQCHVPLDNQKISRQHFKIMKIGDAFRLQDLGSAHGTKLNGVSISDAPLKPFDTIQAATLEVQFLLMDPEMKAGALADAIASAEQLAIGKGALAFSEQMNLGQDVTQPGQNFPMMQLSKADAGFGKIPDFDFNQAQSVSGMNIKKTSQKSSLVGRGFVWFKDQPKPRQIMIGLLGLILLLALAFNVVPNNEEMATQQALSNVQPAPVQSSDEKLVKNLPTAADSKDVSPEFNLLKEEDRVRIQNLYAAAERGKAEKNWQKVFESTNEILKKVKRYKNSTDMMLEAQTYINENLIGSVSTLLGNMSDAVNDNKEQVTLLLAEGRKAIEDKRWDDAQASYSKALNLDPNNEEAMRGFGAAHNKNANFIAAEVPAELPPVVDENFEQLQRQNALIEALSAQLQKASVMVFQGQASEAMPLLKELDSKIALRLSEVNSGRMPANTGDMVEKLRLFQSRAAEGLETARAKLRSEYQVQMADAEQYAANKQYSLARENYDRILSQAPYFDEVIEARKNLYSKILIEAKNTYQEALIYESVGDLANAFIGYEKTVKMLENVDDYTATEYLKKSVLKVERLKR